MNIGIDAHGGDFAPTEILKGIELALENGIAKNIHLTIFFQQDYALPLSLSNYTNVHTVPCPSVIGMDEIPTDALKAKKDSTIVLGLGALAQNKIDAFISAGNTGAIVAGSHFIVKPAKGVKRPCLPTHVPKTNGKIGLLLDIGANPDVRPEFLEQFATMGSIYAQNMFNIENARVGLMNIGTEANKGNQLAKNTFVELKENQKKFIGNIEGWQLFEDYADVVVTDGFTGNIILKLSEGFFMHLYQRGVKDDFLMRFNQDLYGGSLILGINKPVIVGHGISRSKTTQKMIQQAQEVVEKQVVEEIIDFFKS